MKIVGSQSKPIDADLLAKLAVNKGSGGSISTKEATTLVRAARKELKDDFAHSTRGLDRAAKAVSNTLDLAVSSGWVKAGSAKEVIESFVDGRDAGSLKDTLSQIRADIRGTPTRRTTYSSGGGSSGGTTRTGGSPS